MCRNLRWNFNNFFINVTSSAKNHALCTPFRLCSTIFAVRFFGLDESSESQKGFSLIFSKHLIFFIPRWILSWRLADTGIPDLSIISEENSHIPTDLCTSADEMKSDYEDSFNELPSESQVSLYCGKTSTLGNFIILGGHTFR